MSTRCECGKQVSPSLDVCELWAVQCSLSLALHQECHQHSWHPLISVLEGRNKTAKFSSCHNLSALHNACFVQAPFQNNFADRGTLFVMPTSSRSKIWCVSCGWVCRPHSGHYDTLCFSPVIPSCLNHVMGIWQCQGEGENTLALWLLQGEELERWRKWWLMLTINSVEARTEPS